MRIGTNITALKGHNNLTKVNDLKSKSLEKLSTGKRINSASDDAAGLSVSTKMNSKIRGMQMAARNAADGQALVQTAEGALGETTDILQRMRELAVQAANDTYGADEREKIETELSELTKQIDDIAEKTNFNGTNLLGGATIKLQTGADKGDVLEITFADASVDTLGLDDAANIDISDADKAGETLEKIDTALATIAEERSKMGATVNRLDYSISNLNTAIENLSAAESRISDVDMSSEMMNFTKNNILSQASTSMLAQAMQAPNSVLSLLG